MIVVKCTEADSHALAAIKIDPLEIQNDGTDYLNKRVVKPWGHEIERYHDENVAVWWLHIHSGQQTSMHCHPNKSTLLAITGGKAVLTTLAGSHDLSEGDMVIIEKGAFHRTSSVNGPVVLYEMETPPNKRDLVRLKDSYGRGQGYERPEMGTGL